MGVDKHLPEMSFWDVCNQRITYYLQTITHNCNDYRYGYPPHPRRFPPVAKSGCALSHSSQLIDGQNSAWKCTIYIVFPEMENVSNKSRKPTIFPLSKNNPFYYGDYNSLVRLPEDWDFERLAP